MYIHRCIYMDVDIYIYTYIFIYMYIYIPNIPIRLTLGKCIILLSQASMRQLNELKQGQLHVLVLLPRLRVEN